MVAVDAVNTAPELPIVPALTVLAETVVKTPLFEVLAPIAPVKYPTCCPPFVVVTDVATTVLGIFAPNAPFK